MSTLNEMLDVVRELHKPYTTETGNQVCVTCRDWDGTSAPWPCVTATALGATGRVLVEWAAPEDGEPEEPALCGVTGLNGWSCVLARGHLGNGHYDRDGDLINPN